MRVCDAFCGVGGMSAGCLQVDGVEILCGVDCDDKMLRIWAANTQKRAYCATIGKDAVEWPTTADDLFVHLSPPCTALSKARAGSASTKELAAGLSALRFTFNLVLEKGYQHFSIENVSTVNSRSVAKGFKDRHPAVFDYHTFDCADFGVPQSRIRLIISTPETIKLLRETPVNRLTVAEAFAKAGLPLPATHLRSNTNNRDGTACTRSVQQQSFVTTASHPLTWSDHSGQSVRCANVAETAVLMGFPSSWKLPTGSRLGIHALGNAVPPPMAAAIMRCALEAARLRAANPAPVLVPSEGACAAPPSESDSTRSDAKRARSVSYKKYRALKRRVEALEDQLPSLAAPACTSANS